MVVFAVRLSSLRAANMQRLSAYHRAFGREEHGHDVPDVIGRSLPLDDLLLNNGVDLVPRHLRDESCVDGAGGYRIDGDTVRRHLAREHSGKSLDSRLRRDVYRFTLDCERNSERREVDDPAPAPPDECGRDLLTAIDRTKEIRFDDPPDSLGRSGHYQVHRCNP